LKGRLLPCGGGEAGSVTDMLLPEQESLGTIHSNDSDYQLKGEAALNWRNVPIWENLRYNAFRHS
jgi:hypothetical protein